MSQRQMLESGGLKSKLWVAFCPVWSWSWAATPPYTLPTIGHSCPVTYVLISILSTSRVLLLDRPEKLIQMIIQIFQGGQLANLSQAQLPQNHVASKCGAVCSVHSLCSVCARAMLWSFSPLRFQSWMSGYCTEWVLYLVLYCIILYWILYWVGIVQSWCCGAGFWVAMCGQYQVLPSP